jgi:hypothetical protein
MWLLVGLLFAGGVTGGLWYVFNASAPKPSTLTAAQRDSVAQHVADDIEKDPIDLEKATHPTDLPSDVQKKFDGSALSEEHNAAMQEALSALPKIGGELVNTKGAPTFEDDFSAPGSGWTLGATDSLTTREYAAGALRVTNRAPLGSAIVMAGKTAGNFAIQIDATPLDGATKFYYGVVFRQSEKGRFMVFLLSPSGAYAVGMRADKKNTFVVRPTKSPAIRTGGAANTIKVYAVDTHFVFEVNGSIVEVQELDGFPAGDVGVIVARQTNSEPAPLRVAFDNFKLWTRR